jgi:hypothetical protein
MKLAPINLIRLKDDNTTPRHSTTNKRDDTPAEDNVCNQCPKVQLDSIPLSGSYGPGNEIMRSTVESDIANKSCPLCRLLAHHILSVPNADKILGATHVALRLACSFFSPNCDGSVSIADNNKKLPYYLEIHLCESRPERHANGPDHYSRMLLPLKEKDSHERQSNPLGYTFPVFGHESLVHARPLPRTVKPELLRAWSKFCYVQHKSCKNWTGTTGAGVGFRLIDIQKRCLVNSTLQEQYIALSYVWGTSTTRVLTKATLDTCYCEGSLHGGLLPRLVLDVMELAEKLGERYLWVDTACIIQDDMNDKQHQFPIMGSVYSHAVLTVIAAVESADARLPRWSAFESPTVNRTETCARPPIEVLNGVRYTTGQPSLGVAISKTVWSSRGWTYQEGLLTRRALVFTDHQVYWNCPEESWCEDRHTEFQDLRHVSAHTKSFLASIHAKEIIQLHDNGVLTTLCAFGTYTQKVEQYTTRKFGDYEDVLWTFLGILKALKDRFPQGYIWGMPKDNLDAALLWYKCCAGNFSEGHILPSANGDLYRLPIPSWCWIAKGYHVTYEKCPGSALISRVVWHEPIRYVEDYDLSTSSAKLTEDPSSSLFVGSDASGLEPGLLDFALLHFTAETASLAVPIGPTNTRPEVHPSILAPILLACGREIGKVRVKRSSFCPVCNEVGGEFVLHSIDTSEQMTGDIQVESTEVHVPPIEPVLYANIMLIEWCETPKGSPYAVRLGLAQIAVSDWEALETAKKEIILG